MEDYKEFTGKNLDEAMAAACDYFGLERGKLEIEILNDAKSGIFGLVGAKKASVRARKAQLESLNLKVGDNREEKKPAKNAKPRQEKPRNEQKNEGQRERAPRPETAQSQAVAADAAEAESRPTARPQNDRRPARDARGEKRPDSRPDNRPDNRRERGEGRPIQPEGTQEQEANGNRLEQSSSERGDGRNNQRGRSKGKPEQRGRQNRAERQKQPRPDKPKPSEHDDMEEKFPEIALESIDQAKLESEVLNSVDSMTRHIVGETDKEFELSGGKARVRINSGEDSGLLIGRDGQTLSALQYLASCIVSRRLQASVRVQIDAGDYRNRQLEKLRTTALELAQKVKETSKPQSTCPMSAYLRRVVHMALQEDQDVQTHSKGEGSLKRVVIVPKKK